MFRRKSVIIVGALLIGAVSFLSLNTIDNKNFELAKNLDIYYSLFRELNTFYVDDVNPGELVEKSIDEMLKTLDPYTTYIPESDIEDFRFMTTGEYGGIGALISKHGNNVIVSEPYEGFPAQKSGLRAGDVFLEISGNSAIGLNTEDISNMLKGTPGETLIIKVERFGEKKPLTFELVREKITLDPVSYSGMLDDKTAYIRLSSFTRDCAEKVKAAFLELKEVHGAEKLVFDLRGNSGGLLVESVNLCNLFIPKGEEVVSTKGKVTQWDRTYKTMMNPVDTLMPLVVLVNRGSASASEIVSGTIQDLDRGVVIGSRTFGKGLVQTTRDLSYNTKLKVTTAKYYTPSGRCIQMLDYAHRNDDGSVGHIPDSLISQFSTRNGRKVFDGGGVTPDLKSEIEDISDLTIQLLRKFKMFDFATAFQAENETIASVEDFEIDEQIYNDFVEYIIDSDFSYTSETQKLLEKLKKSAEDENYLDKAADEFAKLEDKLGRNLEGDLDQYRPEISRILKDEIISRYYYQKGAAKAALIEDETVKQALEILANSEEYQKILQPM